MGEPALMVPCPACRAEVGKYCTNIIHGGNRYPSHVARLKAYLSWKENLNGKVETGPRPAIQCKKCV